MLKLSDEHKKLIRNSQLKVLKFKKLAPSLDLNETSSEERDKDMHEIYAKRMFDKNKRMQDGQLSNNGSFSARSARSYRSRQLSE